MRSNTQSFITATLATRYNPSATVSPESARELFQSTARHCAHENDGKRKLLLRDTEMRRQVVSHSQRIWPNNNGRRLETRTRPEQQTTSFTRNSCANQQQQQQKQQKNRRTPRRAKPLIAHIYFDTSQQQRISSIAYGFCKATDILFDFQYIIPLVVTKSKARVLWSLLISQENTNHRKKGALIFFTIFILNGMRAGCTTTSECRGDREPPILRCVRGCVSGSGGQCRQAA